MAFKKLSASSVSVESATIAVSGTGGSSGGTPPSSLITATGGAENIFGVYKCHTFTGSGTLTITSAPASGMLIEYVVVAGGGASGSCNGATAGAGGAGGCLTWYPGANTTQPCVGPPMLVKTGDVITVVVGSGGAGVVNNSSSNSGTDSYIDNGVSRVLCIGGGGGGPGYNLQGLPKNGGSAGAAGSSIATTFGTTGPYPYQPGYNTPYKQGNANNGYATGGNGAGGAVTGPAYYTTNRTLASATYRGIAGLPYRAAFNGTYYNLSPGGPHFAAQPAVAYTSAEYGGGGGPKNTTSSTGSAGSGGNGIVMIRYYNSSTTSVIQGMELLLVGGGGAGNTYGNPVSGRGSSGGGAGGLLYFGSETAKTANGPALNVPAGTYVITIGAGGSQAGGAASVFAGLPADNLTSVSMSIFGARSELVAYGGVRNLIPRQGGDYGGSTSGGAGLPTSTETTVFAQPCPADSNQGTLGGVWTTYYGGGGGAGGAGTAGVTNKGGNGGIGLQYSISGTATYYAGGGGGYGGVNINYRGLGAQGGGGDSAYAAASTGTSGQTNTGGGAGGDGTSAASFATGGSGVCILRYPDSYQDARATTGSPTITVSGGWRTYVFTSSGTITF